jgi:hypothetical protein
MVTTAKRECVGTRAVLAIRGAWSHVPMFNPAVWFPLGTGVMVVGGAFLSLGFSEVETETTDHLRASLTGNTWFWLGIVLLCGGVLLVAVGVVGAVRRYQEQDRTPFKLSLDGEDCVQIRPTPYNDHQARVMVTNDSEFGVLEVRAKIRDRVPGGYSHYLSHMHDAHGAISLSGDDLAPGDSIYVDVADMRLGCPFFCFSYATSHLREQVTTGHHTFTIEVRGRFEETRRSTKACSQKFALDFDPTSPQPLKIRED